MEIKSAEFSDFLKTCPVKKSGDCYSAKVSLSVYNDGMYSHKFNCFIDTTAKFSKNCRVRSYDNEEGIFISDFLKKNQTHQWHYNWLGVYSVDDDGYITDCMIYSAG